MKSMAVNQIALFARSICTRKLVISRLEPFHFPGLVKSLARRLSQSHNMYHFIETYILRFREKIKIISINNNYYFYSFVLFNESSRLVHMTTVGRVIKYVNNYSIISNQRLKQQKYVFNNYNYE